MSLLPLDDVRAEAQRMALSQFQGRHPHPILLATETIEGDLHFAPESQRASVRAGDTLLHVPRITARERLEAAPKKGRRPLDNPTWFPLVLQPGQSFLAVGRRPGSDLLLKDVTISADHARLYPVPSTEWVFLTDHESRNGTVHNGTLLVGEARAELLSGDEVCFGRQCFVYLSARDFYRYLSGKLFT